MIRYYKKQHRRIKLVFLSTVERYNLLFLTNSHDVNLIAKNFTPPNSSGLMVVLNTKDKLRLATTAGGKFLNQIAIQMSTS